MTSKQAAARKSGVSPTTSRSKASETRKRASFTATEAKNEFGQLLERAIRGETVVITKHDTPKAVLISIEKYNERNAEAKLDTLSAEFDAMFERMQTPQARAAVDELFASSPVQLGEAAVRTARKRG